MATNAAPRWMMIVAYVAFALGAVLLGIEFIQLVSDVELLDNPWSGAVGMWLLAFVLYGVAKRSRPSQTGGVV